MISKLRKRIIVILLVLSGTVYLTILISINLFNYNANIQEQKKKIRWLVEKVGIDAFCEYPRTDSRLEEYEYCVVRLEDTGELTIISNYMPDYSEENILRYSSKISAYKSSDGNIHSLVYVRKSWEAQDCKVFIFMSNDFAVPNSKNLLIISSLAFLFGMIVLFIISKRFSKWLIFPAEKAIKINSEFISNAGHELKTPLAIISANAEFLQEEHGDNLQLSYIRKETSKMAHLVGEMLTLVRMDSVDNRDAFTEFNLSGAMEDVVLPFESIAFEKKLEFNFRIAEGLRMYGNYLEIQRMMSILLDNAMSYTPEGGSVNVEVDVKNKKICMEVANTGEQIAGEMQEKIFQRFYRENESREDEGEIRHFGLGLSIAKSIVERHRGKISVKSQKGINTFLVVFPVMNQRE